MENRQYKLPPSTPEDELRDLLERMPQSVLVLRKGRVLFANAALAELLGYRAGEVEARTELQALIAPPDRVRLLEACAGLLRAEPVETAFELRGLRRDGTVLRLACALSPVGWRGAPAVQALLLPLAGPAKAPRPDAEEDADYRGLLEQGGEGVLVTVGTRIRYANPAGARLFGYDDPADLGGTLLSALLARGEGKRLKAGADGGGNGNGPAALEITGVQRDGSKVPLAVTRREVRWQGAAAVRLGVSGLTALHGVQGELERNRALLEQIVENLPLGLSVVDKDLNVVAHNRLHVQMYGLPEHLAAAGVSFEEIIRYNAERGEYGPGDAETQVRERVKLARRFLPHHFERTRPDGTVLEIRGNPLPGGGFISTTADVTAQRAAEERLRAGQRLLQTVLDTIPHSLFVMDTENRYLMGNETLASRLGIETAAFVGRTPEALGIFTEQDAREIVESNARVLATGKRLDVAELPITLPGGELRFRRRIKLPLRDDEGRVMGVVGLSEDITERKQAEERGLAAQRMLQTVFDTVPQALYAKDTSSRFLMVNWAMAALHGRKPADFVGHTAEELGIRTRAEREAFLESDRRVFRTGQREEVPEFVVTLPSGERRVRRGWKLPLRDEAGNVTGYVGTSEDITDWKRSEEALRASEERFRYLVEASVQGIIVHREREVLFANPAAAAIFGYDGPGKIEALKGIRRLMPGGEIEQYRRVCASRRRKPSPQHFIVDGRRADGSRIYLDVVSRPVTWDGRAALQSAFYDITEREKAEEELRYSQERLSGILQHAMDAVVSIDAQRRILLFNRGAEQIFGYTEQEVRGKRVEMLMPPEYRKAHPHNVHLFGRARQRKSEQPMMREVVGIRKNGERFPAETTISKLRLRGEWVFTVMMRDITDRKQAEAALRASERLLQTIFDTLPLAVMVKDKHSRFVMVNRAMADSHGVEPADITGRHTLEAPIATPPDRRKYLAADRAVLRSGQRVDQPELHITLPNGEKRIRRVIKLPLTDEQGKITGLLGVADDITEDKQAEAALRESEERFRNLIEGSVQGVLIVQDGRIAFVNDAFCRIYGVDAPEHILNMDSLAFIPPDDRERMVTYREARRRGENVPSNYVHRGVRRDGALIWVENTVQQVTWRGRPANQVTIIDITERKQADEALRASQRLLKTVFDTIPHWIFVKDREARYIMANTAMTASLALTTREMLGTDYREAGIGAPEEQRLFRETDDQVLTTGRRVELPEMPMTLPDGTYQVRALTKLPLLDDAGNIVGLVGVSEDITARKQAEEGLRNSQRLLQTIFDTIPLSLWVKDREGRFILTNRKFSEFAGLTAEEASQRTTADLPFGTPEERQAVLATDRAVMEGGEVLDIPEETVTFPDGTVSWRHTRKAPLHDSEGTIVGMVGIREDITERKRAEQAMFQAQKLESLGVLAGGVAHDFNNILVSIIGNAGLALMNLPTDAAARQEIRQIETAGQRAAELCRQMLAYAGRAQLVVENIELNAIVDDMAHLAQVNIPKQCVLAYRFAQPSPVVMGDPGQIQQVVMNLVINAAEAIGTDRGVITVSTGIARVGEAELRGTLMGEGVRPGEFAYLEVVDTGCGMDAATLRRIFDPFFSTKFTGRGLGLAAVLGIVRGHKGALKVESRPGRGTAFRLYLPPAETPPSAPALEPPEAWQGHGTVLIVDDEPDIREVAGKILESLGFSILTAGDGLEGVQVFQAHAEEIRAVLLDLTMPVMTGDEALEELRRMRDDVVVLLMSGYHEQELVTRFAGRGIADFLQKPFAPSTLREKLQKHVS